MIKVTHTEYATIFTDDHGNEYTALGHYDSYEEYIGKA